MAEQQKVFKPYRYYEGTCSVKDFLKELAKVLSVGVRSSEIKDSSGNTLLEPLVLQSKNWDIVYPAPDSSFTADLNNLTADEYKAKINNQIAQISDTVILKTDTTPIEINSKGSDDIAIDPDVNKESLSMYLEIYKPTYVANPEGYPLDCERDGIIPKVITKKMYEDAFKTKKRIEETVTLKTNDCCEIDESTTVGNGIKTYTNYSECLLTVTKIINAYNGDAGIDGFYMPQIPGMGTADLSFNKTEIMNIKSKDNELYNIIREILNIDDVSYQKITTLKFNVSCVNPDEYELSIQSETVKNIYTILKDTTYELQEAEKTDTIINNIIPEYFIDGIYIPLSNDLWEYDPKVLNNRGIKFLSDIVGDMAVNGSIVIRYDIAKPEDKYVSKRTFMLNNHYCLMRIFDELNEDGNGPSQTTYDDNGAIIVQRAHVSEWAKLSWYKDFEEVYKDDIDADSPTTNITDGTLYVPLETPGLNSETKLRYWINTNNDRFNMVIMGNASLDFIKDRHLTSVCCCGKIDSFENSIMDVAGNFMLFTSSSTEPCKTTMDTEKKYDSISYDGRDYSKPEFASFLADAYKTPCIDGFTEYYIHLPDGRYFDKDKWPKYMIIDTAGNPVIDLTTVYRISYLTNNEAKITIHDAYDTTHSLVISYSYYTEKITFNSGVTRDIFGNVESVDKPDAWGNNTSDGVTSVMMYHTKSKAYYQKHQIMFTTTEEYMSKKMYGKSQYTGEYYADRVKVTHGNDGPRGMLNDILVIDNSSLYPFDELVINKDFEKDPNDYEETYVYFPITAPFSPLSDSPNARYGFAIKKKEVEPKWTDEHTIVDMAIQELTSIANEAWWGITTDIFPTSVTTNGCSVLWEVVEGSEWYGNEANKTGYTPIDLCLTYSPEYHGTESMPVSEYKIPDDALTAVSDASYSGSKLVSRAMFDPSKFTIDAAAQKMYYGVASAVPDVLEDDVMRVVVEPDNNTGSYAHADYIYPISNFLYCGEITNTGAPCDVQLKDAAPGKYLIVYGAAENGNLSLIKNYGYLKITQDMIKYPCEVHVMIASGSGHLETDAIVPLSYGSSTTVKFKPDTGWRVDSVKTEDSDGNTNIISTSDITSDGGVYSVTLTNITRDTTVLINLASDSL